MLCAPCSVQTHQPPLPPSKNHMVQMQKHGPVGMCVNVCVSVRESVCVYAHGYMGMYQ